MKNSHRVESLPKLEGVEEKAASSDKWWFLLMLMMTGLSGGSISVWTHPPLEVTVQAGDGAGIMASGMFSKRHKGDP